MSKLRNTFAALAMSTAAVALTAGGTNAAASTETGSTIQASCNISGVFCGTADSGGGTMTLRCGEAKSMPWSGGGYWSNKLPNNGVVRMFDADGLRIYTTPPNYGPVRGNWTPVYSLRADC
ncbi:hypothetical protein [Streptomyces minutiscleroticus]|uniref:Streptomyces killer toxin-like beta/gamma crystallin domain-containing protein n=1 Tax=Streptomyces minutiscleroticus TaxID=68238 RepID=A0A918UAE9_9ACTN|nr:hypothetical protein [Streptomyces minutiscleroticus]GGY21479.1 hypothetical protein GCM10010358_83760 [Streptomyces minutiscleroticus]